MAVDAIGSLDDEELRVRALQGVASQGVHFTPIAKTMAPAGLSPVSSLAPSSAKGEPPQHRPDLPPPKHMMIDIIATHRETERLASKGAKIFDAETAKALSDIERLNTEKQEALENEAKAVKARNTWNVLSIISQYIAGASALVLGAATWGISALAGGLLIASGGLGLLNRVVHDTSLLDTFAAWWTKSEELQTKIARNIDMGMFFLQMGFGMAGGAWAWQTGALAAAAINSQSIKSSLSGIIGTASGVMGVASQVGIKLNEKKMYEMQALVKEANGRITTDEQTMYQDSNRMTKMIQSAQAESDELRKAIQSLQISID